jgi:hypothetical protein
VERSARLAAAVAAGSRGGERRCQERWERC